MSCFEAPEDVANYILSSYVSDVFGVFLSVVRIATLNVRNISDLFFDVTSGWVDRGGSDRMRDAANNVTSSIVRENGN